MAQSLAACGFNLAMDIVNNFPPRYWEDGNESYGDLQYLIRDVDVDSSEFSVLESEIEYIQNNKGVKSNKEITEIHRIQNPYTYASFMLRKQRMIMKYGYVHQVRKCKLIDKKYLSMALKYNCDGRRFGKLDGDYIFYHGFPGVLENSVLLLLQVLTLDDDYYYNDIECDYESEFYIEYVVYFD